MKISDCEYQVIFQEDDEFHAAISYSSDSGFAFFLVGGWMECESEKTQRRAKEVMDWMLDTINGEEQTYLDIPFTLKDITYSVIENYFRYENEDGKLILDKEDRLKVEKYRQDLLEQLAFLDEKILYIDKKSK